VIGAESTVIWTLFDGLGSWIQYAFADFAVLLKPVVCLYIRPIHIFEVSMFCAIFDYQNLSVSFHDCGIKPFQAFGA